MRLPKLVQAELALLLITVVWGSTFTIVKKGLEQASPVLFVAMRFWIATAAIAVVLRGQIREISRKTIGQGIVLSLALLGGFVFQTLGLRDTTPSNSAFITSLCVLLVPLLGFMIYRWRPSKHTVAGVLLATIGLVLLLADSSDFSLHSGDSLTLICAFLFALQILFLGLYVQRSNYRHLIFVMVLGSAILCSIVVPVLETPRVVWSSSFIFYLFILGVFATAVAFFVQGWAQQYSNPNHTALIFSLEPVFAAVFAYWMLGQTLSPKEWIGGILILIGILVSEMAGSIKRKLPFKDRLRAG